MIASRGECLIGYAENPHQDLVIDGLRNAVNAYAWARRAYDLRVPCPQTDNLIVQWDEEDQQLLDEASFDMIPEPI